jgi:hypothetical protein
MSLLEKGPPDMNATTAQQRIPIFDYKSWNSRLPTLAEQYRDNAPFPHIHLENLLDPNLARGVVMDFPEADSHVWIQYKHQNENKIGLTKRAFFSPRVLQVLDELNSPTFLSWLTHLTGIHGLVSDETLEGGGLHQSSRGGFLNVHADFTMHHYQRNWRRRINLILYLNEGWREDWGGSIELWNRDMRSCETRYLPLFNHALIFSTGDDSFHGFPDRLTCPPRVSRKSLALYYYTPEAEVHGGGKSTNYRARPTDGAVHSALIWADKQAVHLYSRVKETFGLSDDVASRVLGFFSRQK